MAVSNKPPKRFFFLDSAAEPFCVGHLRIDFGRDGDEYWSKFFEHTNTDQLLTETLRKEINQHVHGLYSNGMLRHLKGMRDYCKVHPESILGSLPSSRNQEYGFITHGENLTFYTRCRPIRCDYQAYIYIYTKHFEEKLNEQSADDPLYGCVP